MFFTYILYSENGAVHKGFTTDIQKRFEEHCI
jgi:predicted GIY-YIG superfamily endonuclease